MTDTEVILFDLDLTLCERAQSDDALLTDAFERANVDQYCTPRDLAAVVDEIGVAEDDREFYERCFAAAARRNGSDPAAAPALAAAYDDLLDHSAVSFLPGAGAALAAARGRRTALVTNGSEETQTEKLRALGIADAFDVTVFADPAGGVHPKPDPAPFERALDALDVRPADALHVGDSLACDVAGANALGIGSVWIPYDETPDEPEHEATHVLPSLAELSTLL